MSLNVPIDSLTERDLTNLVSHRIEESETLDFKVQMYSASEGDRKELCRDLSAMANRRGGFILIGVREEDDCAAEIVGIEDAGNAEERLLSCALAGIEERINGLRTRQIALSNGRSVLAVFVPPSRRAPHMVVIANEDRCWVRHGKQKMRMSIAELRESCIRVEGLLKATEAFLRDRSMAATKGFTLDQEKCLLRVTVTPLALVERFESTNDSVRRLLREPPNMRPHGWTVTTRAEPRSNLHGLRCEVPEDRCVDIHRTGHLEFRVLIEIDGERNVRIPVDGEQIKLFRGLPVIEYTVSVMRLYHSLSQVLDIADPAIVGWTLHNAAGWAPSSDGVNDWNPRSWEDNDLVLPEMEAPAFAEPDTVAQRVLDRVWQSFGLDAAPYFAEHTFTYR